MVNQLFRHLLLFFFLLSIMTVYGCGSSTGEGNIENTAGTDSSPDTPQTVSGPISGLRAPQHEDMPVYLSRIDDSGEVVEMVATTTTINGGYSFDLSALGVKFQSDLIVYVEDPSSGIPIRAFVVMETVNISPASEVAVRLVLEKIAGGSEKTLSNFTSDELIDLVAAVDLMVLIKKQQQSLAGMEQEIAKIREAVLDDRNIIPFFEAASEPGQALEGTGDVGNFFPTVPGNLWRFKANDSSGQSYFSTIAINGTKVINGKESHVFLHADTLSSRYTEAYHVKESRGLIFQGDNLPPDPLFASVTPFQQVQFPLRRGDTFVQFEMSDVNEGDFDSDGVGEKSTIKSGVTVEGFEDVNVPAGFFPNAAKITTNLTITTLLSRENVTVTFEVIATEWFVSNVGLVKANTTFIFNDGEASSSETTEEELIGLVLGGQAQGVQISTLPSSIRISQGVRTFFSTPEFNTSGGLTWISGNLQVATIDTNGNTTTVGPGQSVIFSIQNGQISDPAFLFVEDTRTIKLAINDIVYSPLTQKLYASIASDATNYPGTITIIDPITGEVGPSIFVGEMPAAYAHSGSLALSKEGRYLYVGLNHGPASSGSVRRVDLVNWTAGPELFLGLSSVCSTSPGLLAGEMEVLPDNPNALAISLRSGGCLPSFEGVVIYDYDHGISRSNRVPGHTGPVSIGFSDSSSTLYGFDSEVFYRMSVDAAGVQVVDTNRNLVSARGGRFVFDDGLIYVGDRVLDPITLRVIGTYAYPEIPCCFVSILPDSSVNRAFSLVGNRFDCFDYLTCRILVFDQEKSNLIDIITVDVSHYDPPGPAAGRKLVRWGENGLALLTSGAQLILLRSPLISGQ